MGRFWSSVELTGNQTERGAAEALSEFWSSVELTGNQTGSTIAMRLGGFWSSVELTGNQTCGERIEPRPRVLEQCRTDW